MFPTHKNKQIEQLIEITFPDHQEALIYRGMQNFCAKNLQKPSIPQYKY